MKVFSKIEDVKKVWDNNNLSTFLNFNFLNIYFKNHSKIIHLFCFEKDVRFYAHIFKIRFKKTHNYLSIFSFNNFFLKFLNINVLYLTNTFLTNIPSFYLFKKNYNINLLLKKIQFNYSMIVIPDFLFNKISVNTNDFVKLEVEQEMIFHVNKDWKNISDYKNDLKTKYRSKINKILKKTENIYIKQLASDEISLHAPKMQSLFLQVVSKSNFQGPSFNVESFIHFTNYNYMNVYGYFLNEELVGFSSEIIDKEIMYSYYVGFDKNLNKSTPIYGRILLENIRNAIIFKKDKLILGRTANEFKSNFGAIAKKSFVYLKVTNHFLRFFLKPIYNNIRIKSWVQRNPFK